MPIKDKLPGSKPHLMLWGAISFQSKANKLLQSTTQVLINIHPFAFKSLQIYRSLPSICETWNPLWLQKKKKVVCRSLGFKCLYDINIPGNPCRRGCTSCSNMGFGASPWGAAACAIMSILNLCWWSAQIPHYSRGCIVTSFLIYIRLRYLNVKYLETWTALVCTLMAPKDPFFIFTDAEHTVWVCNRSMGLTANNHWLARQKEKALDLCRDNTIIAQWPPHLDRVQSSLIAFHTANEGPISAETEALIPAAQTSPNRIRHD